MSDTEKLLPALEEVESLSVNQTLLEYYTSMTEHHRTKISVIGGAYLVLAQLLLLTPLTTIVDAIKNEDRYIFASMVGAIISLLALGLLHHAANLAIVAGQRLNILRNIYWSKLPKESKEPDEYTKWRLSFETKNRDITSVSRPSTVFLLLLVVPIFVLTIARYHNMVVEVLKGEVWFYVLLGVFYCLQFLLFGFFLMKIGRRSLHFYRVRDTYKVVQSAKSRKDCVERLTQGEG